MHGSAHQFNRFSRPTVDAVVGNVIAGDIALGAVAGDIDLKVAGNQSFCHRIFGKPKQQYSRKDRNSGQQFVIVHHGALIMGYRLLLLLLAGSGLFLSLWIVITPSSFTLYPLSVGSPEVSPWLMGVCVSAIALASFGVRSSKICQLAVILALLGLGLSALPLLQLPATNQRFTKAMEQAFGKNYLATLPPSSVHLGRSTPFNLSQVFTGISVPSVRYDAGIQFATPEGVPLLLDIHCPNQTGLHPTVVIIHGGAWQGGKPQDNAQFSRYLAAQGYTVAAITYRFAPAHPFPAQIEDVNTAIAFLRNHAVEYEIDVNRMAVMGRSAGAHLAMLAAYAPDAMPFKAVVNYYGPVDLPGGYRDLPNPDPIDTRKMLTALMGGTPDQLPAQYQQASPITLVRPNLPPTLLVYGDRDHIVQAKFGRTMAERLQALGNSSIFLGIPWAEHAFDAVFNGVSNQLALYYTERFLAWALQPSPET